MMITSSSGRLGRASIRSVKRISGLSSRRKKPDSTPTSVPKVIATSIATTPTASEIRPPNRLRGQRVAPKVVGAERILCRGPLIDRVDVIDDETVLRVHRVDGRSGQYTKRQQRKHDHAEYRQLMPAKT